MCVYTCDAMHVCDLRGSQCDHHHERVFFSLHVSLRHSLRNNLCAPLWVCVLISEPYFPCVSALLSARVGMYVFLYAYWCVRFSESLWACATLLLSLCTTWCSCPWSCVSLSVIECTCMCAMSTCVSLCICASLHVYLYTHSHAYLCVCVCVCVCAPFTASLYACPCTSQWVFPQCLALFASLRVFACSSKQ
jgi:hypothetical protein